MNTSEPLVGKQIPLVIERLSYGGDGVGHYGGKVVFVPYSAPGDELIVVLTEDRLRYARGTVVTKQKLSAERTEPRCPVFGECGGCQWQHLSYPAQCQHKETIFRETLTHVGGIATPNVEPIISARQPWGYRERIRLKVDREGKVGFYAAGTHRVVSFTSCAVAHPGLNEFLQKMKPPRQDCELVWDRERKQVNTRLDAAPYRRFAQVHLEQNQALTGLVVDYVTPVPSKTLLELYCGDGNFSLPLAPHLKSLVAVDRDAAAIEVAERRARAEEISQIEFRVGTAEWALQTMLRCHFFPDILLLDPPRQGAKEILDLVVVLSAHKIVYVSCDPASLARDLKFLTQKGYRLLRARPLDMFPQTYHIEAVAELIHV